MNHPDGGALYIVRVCTNRDGSVAADVGLAAVLAYQYGHGRAVVHWGVLRSISMRPTRWHSAASSQWMIGPPNMTGGHARLSEFYTGPIQNCSASGPRR